MPRKPSKAKKYVKTDDQDRLKELFDQLRAEKIDRIEMTYAGSGDEGELVDISIFPKGKDTDHEDEAQSLVLDILENNHPGWELESGSRGTITLDAKNREVKIDHEEFSTVSNEDTSYIKVD